MALVTIENDTITARSAEEVEAKMKVSDFILSVAPPAIDTGEIVLPGGARCVLTRGNTSIVIHETSPRLSGLKWIDKNSPVPFGSGVTFKQVCVALPYVIVFAVFQHERRGRCRLSGVNECFFSNQPLNSLNQQLSYPALLNCSKFDPPDGRPLSWICTQYLRVERRKFLKNINDQIRVDLKDLLHCLFETGFNYSSEHHEENSWFSVSTKVDPRISSIEAWEATSKQDPLFALQVPWISTGLSAAEIAERIFKNQGASNRPIQSADDISRILFNAQASQKGSNE